MKTAAIFAAAAFVLTAESSQQSAPTFRSGSRTVPLYVTVQDKDGRLVTDLNAADFEVLDNGKPAEVTLFSKEIQPITVALLLDMSGSMLHAFLTVRNATVAFVDHLLPADRVRIGSFGEEVVLSPLLTGDKTILKRIAREELWPGGSTPLWTAIYEGMASISREQGRKVVLALTDGLDGCANGMARCKSFGDVKDRAIEDEFMVYAIGMQTGMAVTLIQQFDQVLDQDIIDLAERTGGGHFKLPSGADLQKTFARVADELHHQYVLGFTPSVLDGKRHRVDVKLRKPGLTARSRKDYLASK